MTTAETSEKNSDGDTDDDAEKESDDGDAPERNRFRATNRSALRRATETRRRAERHAPDFGAQSSAIVCGAV